MYEMFDFGPVQLFLWRPIDDQDSTPSSQPIPMPEMRDKREHCRREGWRLHRRPLHGAHMGACAIST
jgi:hypothetical protein